MRKRLNFSDYESIVEIFIEESVLHGECTVSGNYKQGNKAADRLFRIWREIKDSKFDGEKLVDELIESSNLPTRQWISAIALDMHYRVDEALEILSDIAKTNEYPTVRFSAQMTMKTWKKQGWLYR